jgi:aminomethyltransferase
VTRRLRGIATEGRRPPRDGCDVRIAGATSGRTTSGNFSPVLGHGIALAMLPPGVADGTEVEVDVRGAALAGRVVPTPFVSPRPRTR